MRGLWSIIFCGVTSDTRSEFCAFRKAPDEESLVEYTPRGGLWLRADPATLDWPVLLAPVDFRWLLAAI